MPTPQKTRPNWDAIKEEYRAGIKPMAQIAKENGLKTRQAIIMRAKREQWPPRNLAPVIRQTAKDMVIQRVAEEMPPPLVTNPVTTTGNNATVTSVEHPTPVTPKPHGLPPRGERTEADVVRANASVLAALDMEHRADAKALRQICRKLYDRLGATADGADLIREIAEAQADEENAAESNPDSKAAQMRHQRKLDAIEKALSTHGMASTLKTLADAWEKLTKVERDIVGMDEKRGETDGYESVLRALKDLAVSQPEAFEGKMPSFLAGGPTSTSH